MSTRPGHEPEHTPGRLRAPRRCDVSRISMKEFLRVYLAMRNARIFEVIKEWQTEDDKGRRSGGRPSRISADALLVAWCLTALQNRPPLFSEITQTLFCGLPEKARRVLGLHDVTMTRKTWDSVEYERAYDNVRAAMTRLVRLLEPVEFSPRDTLTKKEWHHLLRAVSKPERDARKTRQDRLANLMNMLIEMSTLFMPDDLRAQLSLIDGSYAVDATLIPSSSRPAYRRSPRRAADPTAGWNKDGEWGHEATFACIIRDEPGQAKVFPLLIVAASIHKPGVNPGAQMHDAIASLLSRGYPSNGHLIADRAYMPQAREDRFRLPFINTGFKWVMDYGKNYYGAKITYRGMRLIEGQWYCPAIPDAVANASIEFANKKINEKTYRARIVLREKYRMRPVRKPVTDSKGVISDVLYCPAAGPNPIMACPNKPLSLLDTSKTVITTAPTPAPKVCTNKASISVPVTIGVRYRQEYAYKGQRWEEVYALRNGVEAVNGGVKNPAGQNIATRGRIRRGGLAATGLSVAMSVVAYNEDLIEGFLRESSTRSDGVTHVPRPDRKRDRDRKAARRAKHREARDAAAAMAGGP